MPKLAVGILTDNGLILRHFRSSFATISIGLRHVTNIDKYKCASYIDNSTKTIECENSSPQSGFSSISKKFSSSQMLRSLGRPISGSFIQLVQSAVRFWVFAVSIYFARHWRQRRGRSGGEANRTVQGNAALIYLGAKSWNVPRS